VGGWQERADSSAIGHFRFIAKGPFQFWEALLKQARARTELHANRKASQRHVLEGRIGRAGFELNYRTRMSDSQVEFVIRIGKGQATKNKVAFEALEAQMTEIETDFGAPLEWPEQPEGGEVCWVRCVVQGGHRSPQKQWPAIHAELINAMIRLDKAMRHRVAALVF
jgi:Domain of unknown function (DUF4268)